MELDLRHPGNVLYAENHCLTTLNPSDLRSDKVVGSSTLRGYHEGIGGTARFDVLSGFKQVNATHVVVLDNSNHCVRIVDRTTNRTSTLAGRCWSSGYVDGSFPDARFKLPFQIIQSDTENRYLIADYGNLVIRELRLENQQVSTLVNTTEKPNALLLSRDRKSVFFSWFKGVGQVDLQTKEVQFLTSPDKLYYGFRDGAANQAVFERVEEMVYLNDHLILMTDIRNNVLRVFNLISNSISTVCNRDNGTVTGTIASCEIHLPRSLLVMPNRDQVLIGSLRYIGYLNVTG